VVLWRRNQRSGAAVSLAVVAIYLVFISSIAFWRGGWQLGPRYITAMLPFAMVPVTAAINAWRDRPAPWGLAVALVAVSMVVYTLSCAQFPHFPEKFANPLYEVTFRLIADGLAPYSAGSALGLRGIACLLPVFAVLGGLLLSLAAPRRVLVLAGGLGLATAALILALYSQFPGGGPPAEQAYRWIRDSAYPAELR
jgi:hypothetical protein